MSLKTSLLLASVASGVAAQVVTTVALTTVTVFVPTSNTSVIFTDTNTFAPSTSIDSTVQSTTLVASSSIDGSENSSSVQFFTDQGPGAPTVSITDGAVSPVTTASDSSATQSNSPVPDASMQANSGTPDGTVITGTLGGTLITVSRVTSAGFSVGPWVTTNGSLFLGTPTPTSLDSATGDSNVVGATGKASPTSDNGAQPTGLERRALLAAVAVLLPALAL